MSFTNNTILSMYKEYKSLLEIYRVLSDKYKNSSKSYKSWWDISEIHVSDEQNKIIDMINTLPNKKIINIIIEDIITLKDILFVKQYDTFVNKLLSYATLFVSNWVVIENDRSNVKKYIFDNLISMKFNTYEYAYILFSSIDLRNYPILIEDLCNLNDNEVTYLFDLIYQMVDSNYKKALEKYENKIYTYENKTVEGFIGDILLEKAHYFQMNSKN